jgi:hypothetical protein
VQSVNAAVRNAVPAPPLGAALNVYGAKGVEPMKARLGTLMDDERTKTLVLMSGQYLRREYPLERSTLSAAIVEKLDQVRLAERARAESGHFGETSKGTPDGR